MKFRKLIAMVLAAVMALTAASMISFADTEGIYTYTVLNGSAMITSVNYAGIKELEIPETLGGYPVRTIAGIGNTFSYGTANMVETLYIPASVTSVGSSALRNFDCAKVVVDEKNPNFSADASGVLFNKDKTVLVACPCSLQQTEYVFPQTVKKIENHAFEQCAFIEKIVLPEGLESLGSQSFCQMPRLREINIPEGIAEIGQNMFIRCRSLESITLPSTLQKVSNSSLSETPLKNVIVPDGVTALETFAFESCKKMEWIELPATLQTIGYEVFENCDSLKFIFYRGSIEDWAAININTSNEDDLANLRIVYNYAPEAGYPGIDYTFDDGWLTLSGAGEIPAFAQGDYHYWDLYADQCDVLVVDSGITGVGAYAFENFSALEYVILYAENIAVSENAFAGCDALESIIITGAATFSAESFNAPDGAMIFVDAAQNPELSQTAGIIRFTCEDKEPHLIDDVSMDLYHVIDLVSALAAHYGEIAKITFGNLTLSGVPMQYIAEYDENGNPVILPIEDSALVNGEIKAARLDGTALTFNELIELIQTDGADGFLLMVSDENHPTIINPNVDIEDPDDPDEPPAPEDPEPAGVFDGIKVTFIKVYNTIVKAIKWAVALLNKFFKLLRK